MKHLFPGDFVVENETAADLRRVLAYLEEHGWCQGTARNRNGASCVGHALQMVGGGMRSRAARHLDRVIGCRCITGWNDFPTTTFATVRAALLKAIDASQ